MKLTLAALTALLAFSAHAQDASAASNMPVWRVVVTQTTLIQPGLGNDAVRSLSMDIPDDQCRIGIVKAYDHRGEKESDKNVKLCVGKIDGLPTVTGWVLPDRIQQELAAGKFKPDVDLYESFSFGFDGTKAVLKSLTYTVSITKL